MKKQILSKEFYRMQKLAGIISEQSQENRYEIIDPRQTEQSLDTILDAISLLNVKGLETYPEDENGHYSGGYKHINSVFITSPIPFEQYIRKANDILFQNDMEHLRIMRA
jgi:hypothetical protein